MESETVSTNSGPFRYREPVRCIAIMDICIAFFMLAFLSLRFFTSNKFYHQLYPRELYVISNESPNIFTIITIALIVIYGLQLTMAQLLLSATYHSDIEVIMSRCQKWYWFSIHLNIVLGIELLLLIFAVRDDEVGKRFPIPAIICLVKMIFRSTGNHLIKIFIWDLRARAAPFPINIHSIGHLGTNNNYPFESNSSRHHFLHNMNEQSSSPTVSTPPIPSYEHPPSYEDAIKEKPPYFQEFNGSTIVTASTTTADNNVNPATTTMMATATNISTGGRDSANLNSNIDNPV